MKLKIYSFGGLLFFTFLMPLRASEKRGFDTSEIDTKAIKWRFDGKYTDLKKMVSDFVLETHRIEVPGYPYTFNPSIVRWNNRLLMSFRVNDLRIYSSKKIGLVWLDENFNPVGDPYILKIPRDTSINFFVNKRARIRVQDPRLITINDRLYIIYSDYQIGRMFKAELHFDGEQFFLDKADCFLHFENEKLNRLEKNWVSFQYEDDLLFAYKISPHIIFSHIKGTQTCQTYAASSNNIRWRWGEIRGGTPAILVDGSYLAFFHSSIEMASVQSEGDRRMHYFMGAYRFFATPPFKITHVSPKPIVGEDFYVNRPYRTVKPLACVFPMGIIQDDNFIWISYGKQDHESWVVKLDKRKLLESLKPVGR